MYCVFSLSLSFSLNFSHFVMVALRKRNEVFGEKRLFWPRFSEKSNDYSTATWTQQNCTNEPCSLLILVCTIVWIEWMKWAQTKRKTRNKREKPNCDACLTMTKSCDGCNVCYVIDKVDEFFFMHNGNFVAGFFLWSIKTIPITWMSMKSNGLNRMKNYLRDWMTRSTTGQLLIQQRLWWRFLCATSCSVHSIWHVQCSTFACIQIG